MKGNSLKHEYDWNLLQVPVISILSILNSITYFIFISRHGTTMILLIRRVFFSFRATIYSEGPKKEVK